MLTLVERKIVADRSKVWVGPPCWGWVKGYKLTLREALDRPGFA